jgi:hypothetical protein
VTGGKSIVTKARAIDAALGVALAVVLVVGVFPWATSFLSELADAVIDQRTWEIIFELGVLVALGAGLAGAIYLARHRPLVLGVPAVLIVVAYGAFLLWSGFPQQVERLLRLGLGVGEVPFVVAGLFAACVVTSRLTESSIGKPR